MQWILCMWLLLSNNIISIIFGLQKGKWLTQTALLEKKSSFLCNMSFLWLFFATILLRVAPSAFLFQSIFVWFCAFCSDRQKNKWKTILLSVVLWAEHCEQWTSAHEKMQLAKSTGRGAGRGKKNRLWEESRNDPPNRRFFLQKKATFHPSSDGGERAWNEQEQEIISLHCCQTFRTVSWKEKCFFDLLYIPGP